LAEPWDNPRARACWNENFAAGGLADAFAETTIANICEFEQGRLGNLSNVVAAVE
jgi:hypothetical protein